MDWKFADVGIASSFVTDFGTTGECCKCSMAKEKTAFINKNRYCYECAKKLGGDLLKEAVFEDSDAKFKCPKKKCDANQLSFRELYLGTCCKDASNWKTSYVYPNINVVQRFYEDSKSDLSKKAEALEEARRVFEKAEKEFEKSKTIFGAAKKRVVYLIGQSIDSELVEERPSCEICTEKYEDPNRQEGALPCGHRFCCPCLNNLRQKTCPTCRKAFTVPQIYKLFQRK